MSELDQIAREVTEVMTAVTGRAREGEYIFINLVCRSDKPGFAIGANPLPGDLSLLIGLLRGIANTLETAGIGQLDLNDAIVAFRKDSN